jgi:hypothetical protein
MRTLPSLEKSVTNYPATYLHITEERVGCLYRCGNLKGTRTAKRNIASTFLIYK